MLGGTVSIVAPVALRLEHEARETEKGPLENLNPLGFALPPQAFFSSWEGGRGIEGLGEGGREGEREQGLRDMSLSTPTRSCDSTCSLQRAFPIGQEYLQPINTLLGEEVLIEL